MKEDNNNTQESISGAIIYFNGDILSHLLEKESWPRPTIRKERKSKTARRRKEGKPSGCLHPVYRGPLLFPTAEEDPVGDLLRQSKED